MLMSSSDSAHLMKLNLGCGSRFNPDWVNVDFVAYSEGVIKCDLLSKLPFGDKSFDVIYSSHVLEHFTPVNAESLLWECHRVMRDGGVLRVVVPDLEILVKAYLKSLSECFDDPQSIAVHDWATIQLIDQLTRDEPGGQMIKFLTSVDLASAEVIAKTSKTAREVLKTRTESKSQVNNDQRSIKNDQLKSPAPGWFHRIRERVVNLVRNSGNREFHTTGETHKWMYDRKSLGRLLLRCGFRDFQVCDVTTSYYNDWNDCYLDSDPDGTIYRPDSLYVEAMK
jgi:predicted SAM-dependent methyltransferase